jgi:hypothetical protein
MKTKSANLYKEAIKNSGKSIFDLLEVDDPLYMPSDILEQLLNEGLVGKDLKGLPLRTRSKVVKSIVCEALGYPVPKIFIKTQPRFPGQNFDTYVQKTTNLQIWNEEVTYSRRYVVIGVNKEDLIFKVRVITGKNLAEFDNTGTITTKYQARFDLVNGYESELINKMDTEGILPYISQKPNVAKLSPSASPDESCLMSIEKIFEKLSPLVGESFKNPGVSKERIRGAELQKMVCKKIGYQIYEDTGQFPDIFNQLLEVKLQTSPTIDLGLILPSSEDKLQISNMAMTNVKHRDARYAIFFGQIDNDRITLLKLVVVSGHHFFDRFQRFEGKVVNSKIQLKLPNNFFLDSESIIY